MENEIKNNENKDEKVVSMNSAMQNLKNIMAKSKAVTTTIVEEPKTTAPIATHDSKENIAEDKGDEAETVDSSAIARLRAAAEDNQVNELAPKILEEEIVSEEEDIKRTKKYAWLAYILFFIPLCINAKSPFVRLHANEGLDVFIIDMFDTICVLVGQLVKFTGLSAIFGMIATLLGIGIFFLTTITKIFQIVQVCRGKKTQTPWLWKARFIK